jgi:hypothetical protein
MIDVDLPVIELNATHRCDRCNAQACTVATKDAFELLFCGHHSKKNRQKLFDLGWTIIDDGVILEDLGYKMPELV